MVVGYPEDLVMVKCELCCLLGKGLGVQNPAGGFRVQTQEYAIGQFGGHSQVDTLSSRYVIAL